MKEKLLDETDDHGNGAFGYEITASNAGPFDKVRYYCFVTYKSFK